MAKSELEDFFTDSINSNASKLKLMRGSKETDAFLMIKGFDCKSVARARFDRSKAYNKASEKIDQVPEEDREYELSLVVDEISKPLACQLIASWSFTKKATDKNKMELLNQNSGLASVICAHAATEENYYLKK